MARKDPAPGGFEQEKYFVRFVQSVDDLIDVFTNISISPYMLCRCLRDAVKIQVASTVFKGS